MHKPCFYPTSFRGVILMETQDRRFGGVVTIENEENTATRAIELEPVSNPKHFEECGNLRETSGDGSLVRVVMPTGSPVISRSLKFENMEGASYGANPVGVSPLGCLSVARGSPDFFVVHGPKRLHAFVGKNERAVGLVRFDDRIDQRAVKLCATNFEQSIRDRLARRTTRILVPVDAETKRSFEFQKAELCGNQSCGKADWKALESANAEGNSQGRCILLPSETAFGHLRAIRTVGGVQEAVLSERLNSPSDSTGSIRLVSMRTFRSAEDIAASLRFSLPQCRPGLRSEDGDVVFASEVSSLVIQLHPRSSGKSTQDDVVALGVTLTARDGSFQDVAQRISSAASDNGVSRWRIGKSKGDVVPFVSVTDATGRVAPVAADKRCVIKADPYRPEMNGEESVQGKATVSYPIRSHISLFEGREEWKDSGILFSYALLPADTRFKQRDLGYDSQRECLAEEGFVPTQGVIPFERVGNFVLATRACSLSGQVVSARVEALRVDATPPSFSLQPDWFHFSVEGPASSLPLVPLIGNIEEALLVELHAVHDDAAPFRELVSKATCVVFALYEGKEIPFPTSCTLLDSRESRKWAALKVSWNLHDSVKRETSIALLTQGRLRLRVTLNDGVHGRTQFIDFGVPAGVDDKSVDLVALPKDAITWTPSANSDLAKLVNFYASSLAFSVSDAPSDAKFWDCVSKSISPEYVLEVSQPCAEAISRDESLNLYGLEGLQLRVEDGLSQVYLKMGKHWSGKTAFFRPGRFSFEGRRAARRIAGPLQNYVSRSDVRISMGRIILRKTDDVGNSSIFEVLPEGQAYEEKPVRFFERIDATCLDCQPTEIPLFIQGEPVLLRFSVPLSWTDFIPESLRALTDEENNVKLEFKSNEFDFGRIDSEGEFEPATGGWSEKFSDHPEIQVPDRVGRAYLRRRSVAPEGWRPLAPVFIRRPILTFERIGW